MHFPANRIFAHINGTVDYFGSSVFSFSVLTILADRSRGEIKSFGVFDFVTQGVHSYVARRNRAQKKRIIISSGKFDRISSAFYVFALNKSSINTFIRFFGLIFFVSQRTL